MKYFPEVVIVYEHKARELFSSYLLKYELERAGAAFFLFSWKASVLYKFAGRTDVP